MDVSETSLSSSSSKDSSTENVRVVFSQNDPREGVTVSSLFIRRVDSSHNGQFTCLPSNSPSKTIRVHVLKGEYVNKKCTRSMRGNLTQIFGHYRGHAEGLFDNFILVVYFFVFLLFFFTSRLVIFWRVTHCVLSDLFFHLPLYPYLSNGETASQISSFLWKGLPS